MQKENNNLNALDFIFFCQGDDLNSWKTLI